jgi:hypothetical protein
LAFSSYSASYCMIEESWHVCLDRLHFVLLGCSLTPSIWFIWPFSLL